jgi:hypothetical protein
MTREIGIIICDGHAQDLGELVTLRRSQGWTVGEYVYQEPIISKLKSPEIQDSIVSLEGEMVGSCLGTAAAIAINHGALAVYFNLLNVRTGKEIDTITQRVKELRAILEIEGLLGDTRIVVEPALYWR